MAQCVSSLAVRAPFLVAIRFFIVALWRIRLDQTLWPGPDQILATRFDERLFDDVVVFRIRILHERPLLELFLKRLGHVHRLHVARIQTGVVHARRQRARRRIKVLHLLWRVVDLFQVARQLDGVLERAARMGAHQIRHQILVHAKLLVFGVELVDKLKIQLFARLAHLVEQQAI